jgi:hypothetical protein
MKDSHTVLSQVNEIDELINMLQNEAVEKDIALDSLSKQTRELVEALKQAQQSKQLAEQATEREKYSRTLIENELVNIHQKTQTELMVLSVYRNYVLIGVCLGISIVIYVILVINKHQDASAFGSTVQTIITLLVGFATGAIAQAIGFNKADKETKK